MGKKNELFTMTNTSLTRTAVEPSVLLDVFATVPDGEASLLTFKLCWRK
ncbi:MAG: hypothetical protein U1F57_04575 [bacterium]